MLRKYSSVFYSTAHVIQINNYDRGIVFVSRHEDDSFLLPIVQAGFGSIQPSIQWVMEVQSSRVKQPEREADCSPQYSAKLICSY